MQMGPDADFELTSKYLESPKCLQKTLLMLLAVQITSLEGTRPELLLVKLLLDHSLHLEKMIIRPKLLMLKEGSRLQRTLCCSHEPQRKHKWFTWIHNLSSSLH